MVQQFDWEVPDWVVIPGGNLGNVSALGAGFLMMKELGVIQKLPRICVAQAEAANPLYRAYRGGWDTFQAVPAKPTLASAIQIGNPVSVKKAIRTLQRFEGVVEPHGLNFATAILAGASEWAYLSSFVWAAAAHGRAKIPLISRLQLATVLMAAVVALAPRSVAGLWVLAGAVLAARVCIAGVQTLRTTVWRANYSRHERARVQGKFATIQSCRHSRHDASRRRPSH